MNEDWMDEMVKRLRGDYNPPPRTPREEMWAEIQTRIRMRHDASDAAGEAPGPGILSLEEARRTRATRLHRSLGWAGAAAAVLILGLAIGRMTAPGAPPVGAPVAAGTPVAAADPAVLRAAALDHLSRTESLLTLVRADARAGRLEPGLGSWARGLLSQTRLLMDAQGDADPVMAELLEDLELVLVQIVGVANTKETNGAEVRSELNLALDGLEEREILPRIQAVVPAGPRFVGT